MTKTKNTKPSPLLMYWYLRGNQAILGKEMLRNSS